MALAADDRLEISEVGFLPATDERVTGTIDAISRELGRGAEEYDVACLRQVGNFPQAFSHLTLILAARAISAAEADVKPAAG